uniref:glucuronosyltransferase n=1 Tax=Panagrellus redivivus TaxID=6233 RepID=A0A7E4WDV7_PANRE
MRVFVCTVFLISVFLHIVNAANVLVVNPYISHSHFAFMVKLTDILADEGHNMSMVITELDTTKFAPLPKKARIIIRSEFSSSPTLNGQINQNFWNDGYEVWDTRVMFDQFMTEMNGQCERLLSDTSFIESMKAESYDIALIEPTDFCGYGFLKLIGVPNYVNIVPFALAEKMALAIGLPGRDFEPYPTSYDWNPELTYFERLSNYVLPMLRHVLHKFDVNGVSSAVVRKYVDPNFHMNDAVGNARFTFLNTEEHMDFPRPISHKVIYIGGITVSNSSADDLPEDYKQIFDSSKKGVVLVSFGSLAKSTTMSPKMRQSFLDMFAAFPEISFIWKYENTSDTVANDLPNVFKKTWIPQPMVLAHPKLLAFITHGGMNSVMEAGHAGVPLLGIPLFADQDRNLKMLEYRRSAVVVEKNDITSEALISAMHKLTDDDSYRTRARTIAALARTKPLSGKQRFIAYFNHAVQFVHAEDHLDIGHRKLDTFRYYNLDIFATFFVVALIVSVVFVKLLYFIVRLALKTVNQLSQETKKGK